jgi:hypothetical protein
MPLRRRRGFTPSGANSGLFPQPSRPPPCHLLLSVKVCAGSLLQPTSHGALLIPVSP